MSYVLCRPDCKRPRLDLLQPPAPIRPNEGESHRMMTTHLKSLTKIKEEYNTENCSNVAARTRPFYFRGCKSRKILLTTKTSLESLPDELIFEILVRVPAKDIYNTTRLVCRKWYIIIHTHDFIRAHLHQSKTGFLVLTPSITMSFFESGKGQTTEISKFNYIFYLDVLSSCNGLVLELHDNYFDIFITNPITQQNYALPPFYKNNKISHGYAIAHAATSMKYKVVRAFFITTFCQPRTFESQDEHVAILTVGVDKDWTRCVNTRHLSLTAKRLFLSQQPFTTEGFVHWAQNDSRSKFVLTLNIETEIFTQFALPPLHPHDGENHELLNYYYLPMGNYLSLLIERSKFSWEFWEMKPETGEWTKLLKIDLEAQFASNLNCEYTPSGRLIRDCTLTPRGWLKPREVLVFQVSFTNIPPKYSRFYISFNVCTREFHKFELEGGTHRIVAHRNSLVWLEGNR